MTIWYNVSIGNYMNKFIFWYKTEIEAKDIREAVFIEANNKKIAKFHSIQEVEPTDNMNEIGFKCH